ncbi:flagellar protein FlaG [Paenibacillus sp. N1-5-1-14]|uniref:flagellar protein FlaG n=1 Tax=Paenibacillus radicibacter TaxID=2972488 RepID=UPI002158FA59|nr:flagellar protein FlaG [Paenibacillus radicibacter]MCR8645036.1 flagellar protein FlaG [Paenibacillus radicibacter]
MNVNFSGGNSGSPTGSEKASVDAASQMLATNDGIRIQQISTSTELKNAVAQGQPIPVSEEQLIKAIDRAIKAVQGTSTSLNFSVHEKTKQIMVKVIDNDSGKIIREIPPEKNLDFLAKVWEMAGLLVDERR